MGMFRNDKQWIKHAEEPFVTVYHSCFYTSGWSMQDLMTYIVTVNHVCLHFLNMNANILMTRVIMLVWYSACKCRGKSYSTGVNSWNKNKPTLLKVSEKLWFLCNLYKAVWCAYKISNSAGSIDSCWRLRFVICLCAIHRRILWPLARWSWMGVCSGVKCFAAEQYPTVTLTNGVWHKQDALGLLLE